MKLIAQQPDYSPEPYVNETPFADTVCLTLHIKGQRVRPTISPLADRPLTPQETQFATRVADFAARVLA